MKKVVPLHDDLFDFFYEALPGYEHVGERRILLGCWGSLNDPAYCDFKYENMADWGRKMFVTPGVVVDGKLVTNDLVDINLGIRILLGHSYYEDWAEANREVFVDPRPARQPGRPSGTRGTSTRSRSRRSATSTTSTAGRCRRAGSTARTTWRSTPAAARSPGCGRRRWPAWSTCGYVKATGHSVVINLPRTALKPEVTFEWKIPQWSNAHRAQPGPHLLPGVRRRAARCTSARRRWRRSAPATPRPGRRSRCRTRRSASASPRRCAACSATTW